MAFIDLKKAYGNVPRQVIWDTLERRGIPQKYIHLIRDMYRYAETSVRTLVGIQTFFMWKLDYTKDLL